MMDGTHRLVKKSFLSAISNVRPFFPWNSKINLLGKSKKKFY
uniref:Uncharacterized protein n=1 Tax=Isometrus maculatus TaxID=497827 RepID=A0A0U1TYF7_ISOMC|nr:hypothetical protein [Isometrus maculatus]